MKIAVLGASGMLGHQLCRQLSSIPNVTVTAVMRDRSTANIVSHQNCKILRLQDFSKEEVRRQLGGLKPDYVLNCVGLVKQIIPPNDDQMYYWNAIFPHEVAEICLVNDIKFITFGTDCVFSGVTGDYTVFTKSDATDIYGRSKFMGEVKDLPNTMTLRSSIVGHEIDRNLSLLNWFMSNNHGKVFGFRNVYFSGVATAHLSNIIGDIITSNWFEPGLHHIASERISKFDFLMLVRQIYNLDIEVIQTEEPRLDRSLVAKDKLGHIQIKKPWADQLKLQLQSCHDIVRKYL
ncbi:MULTISPECIES: sugar nucleotide-binding protein [unclassified Roseobacter]|uniref:sugar nucleotide-binding protein n=1 Tax=unclassified Roseobacter TaxID=196798 RepID=UPI0030EC768E